MLKLSGAKSALSKEETDFGQFRFGHPDLTNSGQSNFGQSNFGSGVPRRTVGPEGLDP